MTQLDHTYIDDVQMFGNNTIHKHFQMQPVYFQLEPLPETITATDYAKTIVLAITKSTIQQSTTKAIN
jgi:hypothetical protein